MNSLEKACFAFAAAADGAREQEIAELTARIDADNAEIAAKGRPETDPYRAPALEDAQGWVLGVKRGLR